MCLHFTYVSCDHKWFLATFESGSEKNGLQSILNVFWVSNDIWLQPKHKKHFLMIGVKVAIESYRYSMTPEHTYKLTKMFFLTLSQNDSWSQYYQKSIKKDSSILKNLVI